MPDRDLTPPSPCPVLDDQAAIVALSNDLARTIRRLNRDLQACEQCPVYDCCSVLASINGIIDTAIQEVTDEWNLNRS